MKEFLEETKAFIMPFETWYAKSLELLKEPHYIKIGFFKDDGSTEGEFRLVWDSGGIQLKVYDDAWEALNRMPELLQLLSDISEKGDTYSPYEFALILRNYLGYKDITERIPVPTNFPELSEEDKKEYERLKKDVLSKCELAAIVDTKERKAAWHEAIGNISRFHKLHGMSDAD